MDNASSSNETNRVSSAKTNQGILRHRAITGCCVTLSLAVFSLSAFDLRGLIDKPGTLDPNLKFTSKQKEANLLPLHLRFYESYSSSDGSEGLRRISEYSDDGIGFADEKGNVVLPAIYGAAEDFHDGLAAVKFRGEKDAKTGNYPNRDLQKWAFINKSGEIVLPAAYEKVGQFNNGVAPVKVNNDAVLINKKGKIIAASSSYELPEQFGDLFEIGAKNYKHGLIDSSGKFVVPPIYDKIEKLNHTEAVPRHGSQRRYKKEVASNEYFKVSQDGRYGLIDSTGKLLISTQYDEIYSFNDGHAVVKKNFGWGIVDGKNNFVIEPNYEFVSMYDDIIATRNKTDKWEIFDSNGKPLSTKIDGAVVDTTSPWLWDGMAAVVIGDKCAFLDSKGNVAIKPEYDLVQHFSNGLGLVLKDGTWKFIDKNGSIASTMTFAEAEPFSDGKAAVTAAGPLYEFINVGQIESKKYEIDRIQSDARAGQGHS